MHSHEISVKSFCYIIKQLVICHSSNWNPRYLLFLYIYSPDIKNILNLFFYQLYDKYKSTTRESYFSSTGIFKNYHMSFLKILNFFLHKNHNISKIFNCKGKDFVISPKLDCYSRKTKKGIPILELICSISME